MPTLSRGKTKTKTVSSNAVSERQLRSWPELACHGSNMHIGAGHEPCYVDPGPSCMFVTKTVNLRQIQPYSVANKITKTAVNECSAGRRAMVLLHNNPGSKNRTRYKDLPSFPVGSFPRGFMNTLIF